MTVFLIQVTTIIFSCCDNVWRSSRVALWIPLRPENTDAEQRRSYRLSDNKDNEERHSTPNGRIMNHGGSAGHGHKQTQRSVSIKTGWGGLRMFKTRTAVHGLRSSVSMTALNKTNWETWENKADPGGTVFLNVGKWIWHKAAHKSVTFHRKHSKTLFSTFCLEKILMTFEFFHIMSR